MRILPFQALYPKLDLINSNDSFFESVKEKYCDYLAKDFFQRTPEEGLYIYQIESRERIYTGLVAAVDLQDYFEGRIKKHEQTIADKEQMQIQLLLKRRAIIKPVLLGYRRVDLIERWLEEQWTTQAPFVEVYFEREGETHRLWQIADVAKVQYAQQLFLRLAPNAYIADGHHRTMIAAILHERMAGQAGAGKYDRLICALFGSDQLEILDFNRVIDGLRGLSPPRFMALMERLFRISMLKGPARPQKKHEVTLFFQGRWYRLHWRKSVLNAYRDHQALLDAMLLNEQVLGGILGIEDVRNDLRVQYVEGPLGLEGLRQKTQQSEFSVGFCLYPVRWDELTRLVDAGEVLPPKSTWFEPRMKNGLIVYALEHER